MCAAKHSNELLLEIGEDNSLNHSSNLGSGLLLGKRLASDTTSIEKLRTETEESRDDDDEFDDSEGGDDGEKRERRYAS
jgi:hypothetical protein